MAELKLSSMIIAALVLLGTGAVAQAQPKQASGGASFSAEKTTPAQDPLSPPGMRKTLQWDSKTGKWGLRLDVDQQPSRDAKLKEAEVGAFYRVTPSLRLGGAVGLTNDPNPQKPIQPDPNEPRVRLETALKF